MWEVDRSQHWRDRWELCSVERLVPQLSGITDVISLQALACRSAPMVDGGWRSIDVVMSCSREEPADCDSLPKLSRWRKIASFQVTRFRPTMMVMMDVCWPYVPALLGVLWCLHFKNPKSPLRMIYSMGMTLCISSPQGWQTIPETLGIESCKQALFSFEAS